MRQVTLTESGAPGRVVVAGPISYTTTQYIDFVNFLHFTGFIYPSVLLILVGVELPSCVVFTLS